MGRVIKYGKKSLRSNKAKTGKCLLVTLVTMVLMVGGKHKAEMGKGNVWLKVRRERL